MGDYVKSTVLMFLQVIFIFIFAYLASLCIVWYCFMIIITTFIITTFIIIERYLSYNEEENINVNKK